MLPFEAMRFCDAVALFMLGDANTDDGQLEKTPNFWEGHIVQAVGSGTINYMWVRGSTAHDSTLSPYKLIIYGATSATDTAGPKLGETAETFGLAIGEFKKIPLLAPVSITNGNYYALGMQNDAPANEMFLRRRAATGGYRFADTYVGGALSTAPTGVNNGGSTSIWATNI